MSHSSPPITRDFTVAVFVVHAGRVLLHRHRKLGLWLPPGGHIEPNELPDDAARREVEEEAAIAIELIQDADLPIDRPDQPRQLVRPVGIQLESISEGHEHIDLVYFAIPLDANPDELPKVADGMVWLSLDELHTRPDITEEILDWSERAIRAIAHRT
jgi:8-oxo-dGTP pyrophosphatase MutT (NUDIX family)